MEQTKPDLKEQWADLKKARPKMRTRDAAHELGVSEAELIAAYCGETGDLQVTRLTPDFPSLLRSLARLAEVKSIIRNEDVVHEKVGTFPQPEFDDHYKMGMFLSQDIDQRLFMWNWDKAFGVVDHPGNTPRHSLQVFDHRGTAILKIYQTPHSDIAGFQSIFAEFKHEDQAPWEAVTPNESQSPEALPDEAIDQAGFRESWLSMQHTHEFHGLLKRYQLTRTQALRLAPDGNYAVPVTHAAIRTVLEKAAEAKVPIMAFVGNDGLIQIHTGTVRKLVEYRPWYNVMDPNFNLHLNEAGIEQTWIVRKPSANGLITSLEVFNHQQELVLTLFGERKPNETELSAWTELMRNVEEQHAY